MCSFGIGMRDSVLYAGARAPSRLLPHFAAPAAHATPGDYMLEYYTFKEINELVVHGQVEEARRILMEVQARYIALCDEVCMLKQQIRDFEDILFLSQNLIGEGEKYWLLGGEMRYGPFCKPCYDYSGKLMRLEAHKNVWRCPYCGLLQNREDMLRTTVGADITRAQYGCLAPFEVFSQKTC